MSLRDRLRSTARAAIHRAGELAGTARERVSGLLGREPEPEPEPDLTREIAERRAAAAEARRAAAAAAPPPLGDRAIPAQVFGGRSCPWTGRAVRLLQERDIEHVHIDLDEREHSHLRPRLIHETKQHTVPYIFVRGEFVGGYNALSELDRLGQLEIRVLPEEERAAARRGPSIEVAERPNTDEVPPAEAEHLGDRES